jgi:hypothetical protein
MSMLKFLAVPAGKSGGGYFSGDHRLLPAV